MHSGQRRIWGQWLRSRGLPVAHIAAVLGEDVETIERDATINLGRRPAARTSPVKRANGDPYRRPILGATGRHVRTLHALFYDPDRIGELLALDPATVRDFLERWIPLRAERQDQDRFVQPRSRAEDLAAERKRQVTDDRRRRREEERAALAAWGPLGSAGDVRSTALPAAAQVVALASEENPTVPAIVATEPVRNPWVGRASYKPGGEAHGAAKLTWPLVRGIRARHAAGQSAYSLAREHGVHPGTITAIVKNRTWVEPED
jgi:hypothetical protein